MRFEWDLRKNAANIRKHHVDFVLAKLVFDDPLALSQQDRIVDGEERWSILGLVGRHILFVAFTFDDSEDDEIVRIISARKATRIERNNYERAT